MGIIILLIAVLVVAIVSFFLIKIGLRTIARPDEDQGKSDSEKQRLADERKSKGLPPRKPKNARFVVAPEGNTTGFVVEIRTNSGGSPVIDVIPAVPGKIMLKDDLHDPYSWHYEDGKQPKTAFEILFGVRWLGLFRQLRANIVSENRFKLNVDTGNYDVVPQQYSQLDFVHFSRELVVEIKNAETKTKEDGKAGYPLQARFLLKYEEKYPVRARQKVADANEFLSGLTVQAASAMFKAQLTGYYLYGSKLTSSREPMKPVDSASANKVTNTDQSTQSELVIAIMEQIKKPAEDAVGLEVTNVILQDIDVTPDVRAKMREAQDAEMDGDAKVMEEKKKAEAAEHTAQATKTLAQGQAEAQRLLNAADGDRVAQVYDKLKGNQEAVGVRWAEAHEKNETATTFAPGANVMVNTK